MWFNLTLNKFNSDQLYSENKWYIWTGAGYKVQKKPNWHEDGIPRPVSLGSSYPQALENGFIKKGSGAARTSVIHE